MAFCSVFVVNLLGYFVDCFFFFLQLFGLKLPNLFGRGEKMNVEYTHGTKQTRGYSVMFSKPVNANPDIM